MPHDGKDSTDREMERKVTHYLWFLTWQTQKDESGEDVQSKGWLKDTDRHRYKQVGKEISAHDVTCLVSGFPVSEGQYSSAIWH